MGKLIQFTRPKKSAIKRRPPSTTKERERRPPLSMEGLEWMEWRPPLTPQERADEDKGFTLCLHILQPDPRLYVAAAAVDDNPYDLEVKAKFDEEIRTFAWELRDELNWLKTATLAGVREARRSANHNRPRR